MAMSSCDKGPVHKILHNFSRHIAGARKKSQKATSVWYRPNKSLFGQLSRGLDVSRKAIDDNFDSSVLDLCGTPPRQPGKRKRSATRSRVS